LYNYNERYKQEGIILSITVSLQTEKTGEIKEFLEKFYQKDMIMGDEVSQWKNIYKKPLEAVDMISAVMDNSERYEISVYIQMDGGRPHHVTEKNHNSVIKDMFHLFYEDVFM
jgi:hypothetical protein